MTTVQIIPELEAFLVKLRRSTHPLGPHFSNPEERKLLARALRIARRAVLSSPAGRNHWARGYHVRYRAMSDLGWQGAHADLVKRIGACPLWRGRPVTGYEAQELSTDGPIQG
jgi:hypothetical protein